MSKTKNTKQRLFEVFSQNLNWVKEHPIVKFEPDFENGCLCPLCMNVFFISDLDSTQENYLTIEDVPPVSLGGSPKTLTCKICNNTSGHELDIHLLRKITELDFHMFLPNSKADVQFKLNNNKANGTVEIDANGTFLIKLDTKRSNPAEYKKFNADLTSNGTTGNFQTPSFTIAPKDKADERRAEIALLRIAYLLAYSFFGSAFLTNPNLGIVRKQLSNPDEKILQRGLGINFDFPDEFLGINMITQPPELCCFLVIFQLKTDSRTKKYSIALPGPSNPGINIYENIEKILCHGDGTQMHNIELYHFEAPDNITKKSLTFNCNDQWVNKHNIKSINDKVD